MHSKGLNDIRIQINRNFKYLLDKRIRFEILQSRLDVRWLLDRANLEIFYY